MTNIAGTSVGAASSSQHVGGSSLQSPQRAPSPAQLLQEHGQSSQVQIEDWESEDEAAVKEELARVHQKI
jgi:hypothetical protein